LNIGPHALETVRTQTDKHGIGKLCRGQLKDIIDTKKISGNYNKDKSYEQKNGLRICQRNQRTQY